jgi:hypothetical protein
MVLNSWQRAGIAAAAIWSVIAFGLLWMEGTRSANIIYGIELQSCSRSHRDLDHYDFDAYNRCTQIAGDKFQRTWNEYHNDIWYFLPFVAFIPVLVFWGTISFIIVVVRWIRAGNKIPQNRQTKQKHVPN